LAPSTLQRLLLGSLKPCTSCKSSRDLRSSSRDFPGRQRRSRDKAELYCITSLAVKAETNPAPNRSNRCHPRQFFNDLAFLRPPANHWRSYSLQAAADVFSAIFPFLLVSLFAIHMQIACQVLKLSTQQVVVALSRTETVPMDETCIPSCLRGQCMGDHQQQQ
jgi:hypothetical protein